MGRDTASGSRHVGSFGLRCAEFEKWPARPARRRIGFQRFVPVCTGFLIVSMFFLAQRQNVPFGGLSVMEVTRSHILLYSAQNQSRQKKCIACRSPKLTSLVMEWDYASSKITNKQRELYLGDKVGKNTPNLSFS